MKAANVGGELLPALAGSLAQRVPLEGILIMLAVALLSLPALYWPSIRVK